MKKIEFKYFVAVELGGLCIDVYVDDKIHSGIGVPTHELDNLISWANKAKMTDKEFDDSVEAYFKSNYDKFTKDEEKCRMNCGKFADCRETNANWTCIKFSAWEKNNE